MPRPPQPGSSVALVLVRNTVSGDSRVLREAATLRDLGLDVIIGGQVSADEQQTEAVVDGFRVIRLTPVESLKRLLRRNGKPAGGSSARTAEPASEPETGGRPAAREHNRIRQLAIAWAYAVQGVALVLRVRPVLVHANDFNTMWVGVAAKLLRRSRLVYDAHELWPDRNGRREWRPWLLACEWLFVHLADATLTVSPGCAEVMAKRYRSDPPIVVRNVPERVLQHPQEPEGLRAGQPPLAVYVGLIAPGRGLEQAIQALAQVPELRLRLMGRAGDEYRQKLLQLAADTGVSERIEYRPPVPASAVIDTIAGADLGLVLIQPICLSYELSLPNKLFEYAAAGLPVLASDLPVIGTIVRQAGIGEVVPPDDIPAIAHALRTLTDPTHNTQLRHHAHTYGQHTTWQHEQPTLKHVYKALTALD